MFTYETFADILQISCMILLFYAKYKCCFRTKTKQVIIWMFRPNFLKAYIIVLTIFLQFEKSINLQHNTLGCLEDGTNESSTKRLMFQVLFLFLKSCKILCKNPFKFLIFFFSFIKLLRWKFLSAYKKNAWNVRPLLTSLFSHRPRKSAYYIVDCRIWSR